MERCCGTVVRTLILGPNLPCVKAFWKTTSHTVMGIRFSSGKRTSTPTSVTLLPVQVDSPTTTTPTWPLAVYQCNKSIYIISGATIMCPLCDKTCDYWRLSESCLYSHLTYLFDNYSTVPLAVFTSCWANIFLVCLFCTLHVTLHNISY